VCGAAPSADARRRRGDIMPGARDGGAEAAARYRQYEYKAVRDDDDARARRPTDATRAQYDATTEGAAIEDGGGGRTNARRNRRRRTRTRR